MSDNLYKLNIDAATRYNYADEVRGEILIDDQNNVFVASSTQSTDFPTDSMAFQPGYGGGSQDGLVFRMDNNLSNLIWASYLGGDSADASFALAFDTLNNIFVTGGTISDSLPTTAGCLKWFRQ